MQTTSAALTEGKLPGGAWALVALVVLLVAFVLLLLYLLHDNRKRLEAHQQEYESKLCAYATRLVKLEQNSRQLQSGPPEQSLPIPPERHEPQDRKPDIQPQSPVNSSASSWWQGPMEFMNQILSGDKPYEKAEEIRKQYSQGLIVGFADVLAYQRNNQYSLFAEQSIGYSILLPSPENSEIYLALPYPNGISWLTYGKPLLEKMYHFTGNPKADRPKLVIDQPAYVRMEQTITRENGSISASFVSAEKGELRFIG